MSPWDEEEDKNHYRIQTDRRECGCGQYSGDGVRMGTVLVAMGTMAAGMGRG